MQRALIASKANTQIDKATQTNPNAYLAQPELSHLNQGLHPFKSAYNVVLEPFQQPLVEILRMIVWTATEASTRQQRAPARQRRVSAAWLGPSPPCWAQTLQHPASSAVLASTPPLWAVNPKRAVCPVLQASTCRQQARQQQALVSRVLPALSQK